MLGAIIGDIAGSRFEHHNIKTKDFEFFAGNCRFTDDSVMTVAVAKAIIDCNGDYSVLDKLTIKYMQEYGKKYPNAGYGHRFKSWIYESDPLPYNSWGNGSAMRVSPCGFVASSLEEAEKLAEITTSVTHNHPEGIRGAQATAAAIYLARNGKSKEEIREYICSKYYDINFTLDDIRETYDFDVTCQGSVPQAIEAFFEANDFEDAVRNAVSIGGDSDTIAAITGGIAEAYYGIPEDIKRTAIKYLNTDLYHTIASLYGWKTNDYVFFWKLGHENEEFSNWYPSPFVIEGIEYKFCEQYMMAKKALLFGDAENYRKIMSSNDPETCKKLGKLIYPFYPVIWDSCKEEIMFNANLAKFSQNPELKAKLLATDDAVLAEASPYDTIWGIGMEAGDKGAENPDNWKGQNLLGQALMKVRDNLQ